MLARAWTQRSIEGAGTMADDRSTPGRGGQKPMPPTWLRTPGALAAWLEEGGHRDVEAVWTEDRVVISIALAPKVRPEGEARVDLVLAALNQDTAEAGLLRVGDRVIARHVAYLNHEGAIAREVVALAIAACRRAQRAGVEHLTAPSA
jgi:hypothetical protein